MVKLTWYPDDENLKENSCKIPDGLKKCCGDISRHFIEIPPARLQRVGVMGPDGKIKKKILVKFPMIN